MRHNLIVSKNQDMVSFYASGILGEEWYVTDDPVIAIQALEREPFDRLFLDHWLDREPLNGRDVSIWLGQHPDVSPRLIIFATSNDGAKAQKMQSESGRVTHCIPYDVIRTLGE